MCRMGMMWSTHPSMSNTARGRQGCQDKDPLQGQSSDRAGAVTHSMLSHQTQSQGSTFSSALTPSFHRVQRTSVFPQWRGAKLGLFATISSIPMLNYKFLLMLNFQIKKHLPALPSPETEVWLAGRTLFFLTGTRLCQSETRERGIHVKFSFCW